MHGMKIRNKWGKKRTIAAVSFSLHGLPFHLIIFLGCYCCCWVKWCTFSFHFHFHLIRCLFFLPFTNFSYILKRSGWKAHTHTKNSTLRIMNTSEFLIGGRLSVWDMRECKTRPTTYMEFVVCWLFVGGWCVLDALQYFHHCKKHRKYVFVCSIFFHVAWDCKRQREKKIQFIVAMVRQASEPSKYC